MAIFIGLNQLIDSCLLSCQYLLMRLYKNAYRDPFNINYTDLVAIDRGTSSRLRASGLQLLYQSNLGHSLESVRQLQVRPDLLFQFT